MPKSGKYILFGAGENGQRAIKIVGKEKIICFLDNDKKKDQMKLQDITVYWFNDKIDIEKNTEIIITVFDKTKYDQILKQLNEREYFNVISLQECQYELIKSRINRKNDYFATFENALKWIEDNTINGESIICNTDLKKGYPEVTGYYIPSLVRWGYIDTAKSFANWLCRIQEDDGSWCDAEGKNPYIFDTAQVLKGLIAIRYFLPGVDPYIIKGCNWILSCMQDSGRLVTPSKEAWGEDTDTCDEVIHIYCLSPLLEAADIYEQPIYKEKAICIFKYYKENYYDKIMNFSLMSHFYAYLMEALLDLGFEDMARMAMSGIAEYQKENGAVPAYNNVDWVCSTGLFQLALVWYRLGEKERADKAFSYACKLQNDSGGWFGSYLSERNKNEVNTYIPFSEISWAVKYYLDSLYYKGVCETNYTGEDFVSLFKAGKIEL